MGDSLGFSIAYPFSNTKSKYGPLLKLTLLAFLSFLIIPSFTVFGYILRVREAALRGNNEIPALDKWGELTKEGFYGTLALLPYGIIAIVTVILSTVLAGVLAGVTFGTESAIGNGITFVVYFVALSVAAYAVPGAISVYAAERSYQAIYSKKLYDFVANSTYFKGWLLYVVLMIGVYIIALVSILTIIGIFFVGPLASMIRSSFWGRIGREILDDGVQLRFKNSA